MGRTILVSAAVSVVMFLGMYFFVAPRLPVAVSDVPPITGLSPDQAHGLLDPRGLLLVLDGEREDPKATPGTIVEHHPLGGSHLRRGDAVHATLARQAPTRVVPALVGLTPEQAKDALTRAKLPLGRSSEAPSDTIAKGMVAASTPAAGVEVKADGSVDLTISSGPATAGVPKVIGKSLSGAKGLLEKAGFVVGSTHYGSHDDFDSGQVISQKPPAGTLSPPGTKIDLTIND
jgi:eukaryotic-like serine/threonine-protein kinase